MNRYISVSFLFLITTLSISLAFQNVYANGDEAPLLQVAEDADVVIIGTVSKTRVFKHPITDGVSLTVELSNTSAIEAEGVLPVVGRAALRFYLGQGDPSASNTIDNTQNAGLPLGQNVVVFVKNNGVSIRPHADSDLGVLIINKDGTIEGLHGKTIIGVDKLGFAVYLEQFNNCDIDDIGNVKAITIDTDGKITELTRQDALDSVQAFSCPDGGSWSRGNDIPSEFSDIFNLEELSEIIRAHKRELNLPTANATRYLNPPNDTPLGPQYSEKTQALFAEADKHTLMNIDKGISYRPDQYEALYKRALLRGDNSFPEHLMPRVPLNVRNKE